ncbi:MULTISPECIES: CatB-related O-acetyltransferase [Streptococcaceae]|uniref:CatB-related O-acetyltransferase n=1 Tax=Streptococcaceae TaxID=1300 RepID=UPI0009BFC8BF|nr:CatB-related O-acetyltransferase [Lactococcus cremoris]ARE24934.1 CatB-related O-acetyltransferase [Lactococcus cremoris]
MIKLILQELKMYYSLLKFKSNWKKSNKHNNTIPTNVFNIDQVEVGRYTYGQLNIKMFGDKSKFLKIGSFVSIAEGTKFLLAGEHDYYKWTTFPIEKYVLKIKQSEPISKGNIIIEDDVWIGENTLILSGVTIGQGSVIAAGSVISKDVPRYSIVASNRIIKYRFPDSERKKLQLLDFDRLTLEDVSEINNMESVESLLNSEIYKNNLRKSPINEIN